MEEEHEVEEEREQEREQEEEEEGRRGARSSGQLPWRGWSCCASSGRGSS